MNRVRKPAVAGLFYPADPRELRATVRQALAAAKAAGPAPKAIIAPHAGYVYSGPIAGTVYARVAPSHSTIHRVVLLGPSHHVAFQGLAASGADAFETPLGLVPLDREAIESVLALPEVRVFDRAHAEEHSLEVQLPFLQEVLDRFKLAPFAVGNAAPEEVGAVIERLWGGPETIIVVSSDLSHYHDYDSARRIDEATSRAIEDLRFDDIQYDQACGRDPITGLLYVARNRGLRASTLDLRNSGDTAGPRDRVVGYGAYALE
jgi:AmmeMemoRadiSam system protein B